MTDPAFTRRELLVRGGAVAGGIAALGALPPNARAQTDARGAFTGTLRVLTINLGLNDVLKRQAEKDLGFDDRVRQHGRRQHRREGDHEARIVRRPRALLLGVRPDLAVGQPAADRNPQDHAVASGQRPVQTREGEAGRPSLHLRSRRRALPVHVRGRLGPVPGLVERHPGGHRRRPVDRRAHGKAVSWPAGADARERRPGCFQHGRDRLQRARDRSPAGARLLGRAPEQEVEGPGRALRRLADRVPRHRHRGGGRRSDAVQKQG